MLLRCVVYGCSNKKDEEKRISIHQISEYKIGSRVKETKMDFIREGKSKTLDPEQV